MLKKGRNLRHEIHVIKGLLHQTLKYQIKVFEIISKLP